jgi:hypothetical protein
MVYMTEIKRTSKRGTEMEQAWKCGKSVSSIFDIYQRPSNNKAKAFEHCYNEYAKDTEAHDFRETGHNSSFFSVAWITGDGLIRYETASNTYLIK